MRRFVIFVGIVLVSFLVVSCQNAGKGSQVKETQEPTEEKFAIWMANLDGTNLKKLVSDPYRQMTHIRVSPDQKWFTFSRYNQRGKNNCAEETPTNYPKNQNYLETEIMLGNFETMEIKSIVPPLKNQMAVNSYWNSEGDKMLFVYIPQSAKKPQIQILTFDENKNVLKTEKFPLPDHLLPVDPQQVGDTIVFPAFNLKDQTRGVWLVKTDGSELKQVAFPKDTKNDMLIKINRGGDNDPKLSPDLKKVAFMRRIEWLHNWHIYTLDLETGKEVDISQGNINPVFEADAVPEWSSDGKLLAIWHIKVGLFKRGISIWTMKPDGTERKQFEFPEGYNYQSVAFFPGDSSVNNPRIIFSTDKVSMKCK